MGSAAGRRRTIRVYTAAQLRVYIASIEDVLRTHPDATHVCRLVEKAAQNIGDPTLGAQARALADRIPRRFRMQGTHTPRDPQFDEAIDVFISTCHSTFDDFEEHEAAVAANANLSISDCRDRVLQYLYAAGRESRWAVQIGNDLCLSDDQVLNALEHLDEVEGAIEGQRSNAIGPGRLAWLVHLNAHGRNLAQGITASSGVPGTYVSQVFINSQVGVGQTQGPVIQNITFPPVPQDVREVLQDSTDGKELLQHWDNESSKRPPSGPRLRNILTGIKSLIESANVATEVAVHGHAWLTAITHLVTSLPL